MIIKEFFITREDGVNLYRTYSNEGFKIRKIGTEEIYHEAVDIETATFTYEETDELIEEKDSVVSDTDALAEIMEVVQ